MPAPRLVVLALAVLAAACAVPAVSPGSDASPRPPGPSGAGWAPVASSVATGGPPDPAAPSSFPPTASQRSAPPPALLSGSDAGPGVAGALGSWALAGGGTDSPWIPAAGLQEIHAAPGARLVVRFGDGTRIGSWVAAYAAAMDREGATATGLGGRDVETPALDEAIPDALGPGTWVLSVRLGLADGGSATYYWLLRVA